MIKPAYSVSFLLSTNIFVWQNVLYFLDAPRMIPNRRENGKYFVYRDRQMFAKIFEKIVLMLVDFLSSDPSINLIIADI